MRAVSALSYVRRGSLRQRRLRVPAIVPGSRATALAGPCPPGAAFARHLVRYL